MSKEVTKRALTGTDMERHVLNLLSDGKVWTTIQLYQAINGLGILRDVDFAKLPTTEGYRQLQKLGIDTQNLTNNQKQNLVIEHNLPAEPHFKNAIRQALRQLKSGKGGKGLVESVGHSRVRLKLASELSESLSGLSNINTLDLDDSRSNSKVKETVDSDLASLLAEEEYFEGNAKKRFTNYYERNSKIRTAAIAYHGTKCMGCGFDFGEAYGEHGSGYIEVHHLRPVSSLKKKTKVNPITDMAVVCSNCHRMIHRKKSSVLSLEKLRNLIRQ